MAHIEPWAKVQSHEFDNMIVLCAVDHYRFDHGDIPAQSIRVFKSNLALLSGRYNDTEQRVLETFALEANHPDPLSLRLVIPGASQFLLMYLIRDGIVNVEPYGGVWMNGIPAQDQVSLTPAGVALVKQMVTAEPIG
jgi:hypothetical protein